MRYLWSIVALTLLLVTAGCRDTGGTFSAPEPASASVITSDRDASRVGLELSAGEAKLLREIRERGGLRAAISTEASIYSIDETGEPHGLHYELVHAVARLFEFDLELVPVEFGEFFTVDGSIPDAVHTDSSFTYTPDLFDRVDLYVVAMTRLPWREQFLSFIPLHPTRLVYVTRAGEPAPSSETLAEWLEAGTRVALVPDTTYEEWFASHADLESVEVLEYPTGEAMIRSIEEGRSDIAVADANLVLAQIRNRSTVAMHPTDADLDELGWAVARGDETLRSLIARAVEYVRQTGEFDDTWREYYGVSFVDYLDLLTAQQ